MIEEIFEQHVSHEAENKAYTIFKKGVYPARKDAEKAINEDSLFVYEKQVNIAGFIIVDKVQPAEYKTLYGAILLRIMK